MRIACLLLLLAALALGASEGDPRPTLLVIGEKNSEPFGASPAWIDLVAADHPAWKVIADVDGGRTLATAATGLDAILAPVARVDLVLVFVGTNDIDAKHWPEGGAAVLQTRAADLLARLAAHPKGAAAMRAVATMLPVIDARLDRWSRPRFPDGEARSDALAGALRAAAAAAGAAVIDAHAWAKAETDGKGPGRLLGSTGWLMRDWGHPIFAAWIGGELARLMPPPPDAGAFAAWQVEQEAFARLDAALAATGDGLVRHGPALPATTASGLTTVQVPAAALAGATLDLLLRAEPGRGAVVVAGNEKPRPLLVVATADGEVRIESPASAWQLLDEAAPAQPVDPDRFRFNAGKMRYLPMLREDPGARRWLLLRFPLTALAGRAPGAASVVLATRGQIENGDAPLGGISVHLVLGRDRLWHESRATWSTRDGGTPWNGAAVDPAARAREIGRVLAGAPPAVAASAGE